jgi:DNA-binding CsgD family transcriptional regulator
MPSSRGIESTLDELRRLVRNPRRRPLRTAEAGTLLGRLMSAACTEAIEERADGLVFRMRLGEGTAICLLTCHLRDEAGPQRLAPSERAVAWQLCEGKTLAQIARLRGVTINTIKSQVRQIFRKLDVDSRVSLVRRLCP